MGSIRHDPTTIVVGVLGAFAGAVQAAGNATQHGPAFGSAPRLAARMLELRDGCSLLRGTFDTYTASVLAMPVADSPFGPMVVVPVPARVSYKKLIAAVWTGTRDVNHAAWNLSAVMEDPLGDLVPAPAIELSNSAWFLVHQVHEYIIENLLSRSSAFLSECCDFISNVTAQLGMDEWSAETEG